MRTFFYIDEVENYFNSAMSDLNKTMKNKVISVEELNKLKNIEYKKYCAYRENENNICKNFEKKHFLRWKSLNCASIVCEVAELREYFDVDSSSIKKLYKECDLKSIFEKFDPIGYNMHQKKLNEKNQEGLSK